MKSYSSVGQAKDNFLLGLSRTSEGITGISWKMTNNQQTILRDARKRRQIEGMKEKAKDFVEKYKQEIMEKIHDEINKFGKIIKIVM